MVSQAGGAGARRRCCRPCHSFACFLTPRANEQIFNNATEGTKVLYAGFLAGHRARRPGPLAPVGARHRADGQRARAWRCLEPATEDEVRACVAWAVRRGRRARSTCASCRVPWELGFDAARRRRRSCPGRGTVVREGARRRASSAPGPVLLSQAVAAAERVGDVGGGLAAVAARRRRRLAGRAWPAARRSSCSTTTSPAAARATPCAPRCPDAPRRGLGVDGVPACGTNDEVLRAHGLDAELARRPAGGAVTLYLFWDIDGTLLLTARAGRLRARGGERGGARRGASTSSTMRTAGLTDVEIAARSVRRAGRRRPGRRGRASWPPTSGCCPSGSRWRQGRVLPNVRENLEALSGRDDVVNMLLTGNVAGGAEAKLRHYGLWELLRRRRRLLRRGLRPPGDRPPRARAGRRARRRGAAGRAHGRDRRHAARRPLRQGDRRAHARRGHRARLRAGGAARRASRGRRWRSCPRRRSSSGCSGLDGAASR